MAQPIGPGTARFTAALNFNDTEVTNTVQDPNNPYVRNIPATPELTALGESSLVNRNRLNDFEAAQPASKMNFQVNYDLNAWRFLVRVNRFGEYKEVNSGPPSLNSGINELDQTFDPVIFTDVEVAYTVRQGINVAVGANNVLDAYPEKVLKANSFNGIFPYSGFSPSGFFGRFLYSRLTVRF